MVETMLQSNNPVEPLFSVLYPVGHFIQDV